MVPSNMVNGYPYSIGDVIKDKMYSKYIKKEDEEFTQLMTYPLCHKHVNYFNCDFSIFELRLYQHLRDI